MNDTLIVVAGGGRFIGGTWSPGSGARGARGFTVWTRSRHGYGR